ncbi:MAG: hypothetical protein HKN25_10895 [Pyrinomonadaceae bacterium]|nr:hypothetical protein [Pyrinomonadaceae bacterium]
MGRLRSFYDSKNAESAFRPTATKTETNKHEMFCGICGEKLFVDEVLFAKISNAIEEGLDNPLLCEDCEESYEESARSQ